MPDDVPLPATFGDWHDLAAVNLGIAERRDSSVRRMFAGLMMLAGAVVGLSLMSEPASVLLGGGRSGERADVAGIVVGAVVLLGTLSWWFWYRRDWTHVRRLRHAWSRALRRPAVLVLPDRGTPSPSGVDPERQSIYRSRYETALVQTHGFVAVDGVSGFLDFLRFALYPVVLGVGVLLCAVAVDQDDLPDRMAVLMPAIPLVVVGATATVRAWWRFGSTLAAGGLERDDVARWTGWRVLRGVDDAAEPRPWWRRLNLAMLPVAGGGLIVLLARVTSGGVRVDGVVIGVGIVVVPILVVYGSFVVRLLAGRVRASGREVAVRVLVDDVPAQGPVTVDPGRAVLDLGERPVLRPGSGVPVGLDGAALISGQPRMFAARRHWVVLADESQVPLACADVRRLRGRADAAGLRVL
ncbi:hypothetical protein [Isoptericola sp. BMS4]|uniref:hypothetical protein n=1 Tax=Isoptericola sp. BMS4 TaxID=2527875 RepID=UPI001421ACF1|nr:hypothetical protein [Isoptericola sp. BMS4]